MTFSIVAFDPTSGDLGVAVASKFPCVGAVVPWAKAGIGAVATQAWANTAFGPEGLGLMGQGMSAAEAIDAVVEADEGRDDRQVGAVDARGGVATFTGASCVDWAGGRTGDVVAVQGNILVGADVVDAMVRAYGETEGELSDRLLAALLAGDEAGGDRRGRQSAALLVVREAGGYEGRNDRYIDLRVDDHPEAANELARLFAVWDDTMLDPDRPPARSDTGARGRPAAPPHRARVRHRRPQRGLRRGHARGTRHVGRVGEPGDAPARRRPALAASRPRAPRSDAAIRLTALLDGDRGTVSRAAEQADEE